MVYKEVHRVEISEVIRRWRAGHSQRHIASGTGLSRDTVANQGPQHHRGRTTGEGSSVWRRPGLDLGNSTGWCGRCCPGNGPGRLNSRGGSRRCRVVTNKPSVVPPFGHPRASLLNPSL